MMVVISTSFCGTESWKLAAELKRRDVPVILANLKGKMEVIRMRVLFPKPFDSSNL